MHVYMRIYTHSHTTHTHSHHHSDRDLCLCPSQGANHRGCPRSFRRHPAYNGTYPTGTGAG